VRGGLKTAVRMVKKLSSNLAYFRYQASQVGTLGALKLKLIHNYNRLAACFHLSPFWPTVLLRIPADNVQLYLRTGTSDFDVLTQIFTQREYAPLDALETVRSIIDCGANVGYSSLYFLNRYPLARVIAVEPDPANAAICRKNLARYGDRAQVIESAVWSHPARLAVARGVYRDGREWSTRVREVTSGEGASSDHVFAMDMPALLSHCPNGRADILKVDIERSETTVFSNASGWLHRVGNIAIELHDAECEDIFFASLRGFHCDVMRSGELTVCRNIGPGTGL
jgi:FkbM family methyltransferase